MRAQKERMTSAVNLATARIYWAINSIDALNAFIVHLIAAWKRETSRRLKRLYRAKIGSIDFFTSRQVSDQSIKIFWRATFRLSSGSLININSSSTQKKELKLSPIIPV